MKRFIIHITFFCIVCVICCIIPLWKFEYAAHHCTTISPYNRINRIYHLQNVNADMIIMGNSRAEDSYNDTLLTQLVKKKCLNIGWSGYPFNYQYHVMYSTYMKNNTKPKYMLLEIGPWAFLDYVNPIYTIEILPYLNRTEFNFMFDICPELTKADYWLLHRYAGLTDKIEEQLKRMNEEKKSKTNEFKMDYFKEKQKFEHDSIIIKTLHVFLDECSNLGIKVIFVCSPIHTEGGKRFFDMEMFWKLMTDIAKGRDLPILNYEDYYENDTIYFKNPMHLNNFGRDCFTRQIASDLDSLLMLAP